MDVPAAVVAVNIACDSSVDDRLDDNDPMNKLSIRKELRLGDGTILTLTKAEVPDPPAVSFATDIARLNRIWDDTSMYWTPAQCALQIHGHPIALVHWPAIYSYGKKGQWRGTLNKWTDWQVGRCLPSQITS
jgi:hypothetical protein